MLTTSQLEQLYDIWPIALPKRRWKLEVITPAQAGKLKCIWKLEDGSRRDIDSMLKRVIRDDWGGQRHSIHSLSRSNNFVRVIVVMNKMVVDGTHRLMAARHHKSRRPFVMARMLRKI